jgi:hypothetical protein
MTVSAFDTHVQLTDETTSELTSNILLAGNYNKTEAASVTTPIWDETTPANQEFLFQQMILSNFYIDCMLLFFTQ